MENKELKNPEEELNPELEAMYTSRVDDDMIDKSTPCVYGPPNGYDNDVNINPKVQKAASFLDEIKVLLRALLRGK